MSLLFTTALSLSSSTLLWLVGALPLFALTIYYNAAFYLTVRDNLPRVVKTKNTTWTLLFTLFYFEVGVLAVLMWSIFLVTTLYGTQGPSFCSTSLCTGAVYGLGLFATSSTTIVTYVLFRTNKYLGISLIDSLGLQAQ